MYLMGVGNVLGYGHTEVDNAIRQVVNSGNMSTLNCPEEVNLAERLVEMPLVRHGSVCSYRWRSECDRCSYCAGSYR